MPLKNDSKPQEQTLEQNMSILNFAMNNVHEAVFLIDNEGSFRLVNEETCRLLGYSRAKLLTMSVSDINPDFPKERWFNYWKELREKKTLIFETHHQSKDGKFIPVEVNANYFVYNNEELNLALVRAIIYLLSLNN